MKTINLTQVQKELLKIKSLTSSERSLIFDKLKKYSSDGISYLEFYQVIQKLREEYKISETDEKYLRKLIQGLK